MKKLPLISIIVPVYKVEQYLDNCIQSVLAQSYPNWELFLIDDGSPDKCGEMCEEYAKHDKRIIVIHQNNSGQSSARNRALDYPPSGEYVTFLDSDDFWHTDYLKDMSDLAVKHNADIVQCGFVKGFNNVFPKFTGKNSVDICNNHSVFLTEKANIVMWGKLFRLSLFDGIRMPVGLYNEDDWTMWKIYYQARKILITSDKLYYYTVNPASTMARLRRKPDLRYIDAYN